MSNRSMVLAEQLRQIVSSALQFEMRDPALTGITITRVKVTPDLSLADFRFTTMIEGEEDKALKALNHSKGALKRIVAKSVRLRRVPDLRFHYDRDVSDEKRISNILESLDIPKEDDAEA